MLRRNQACRRSSMKLHADSLSGQNTVTAYGPGYVAINGRRYEHSLIVMPDRLDPDWPVATLESLQPGQLASLQCDVVLLGTGARQRFPASSMLRHMFEARIGLEVMDTAAACRTYNILMAEGRNVAAALIIE
jgi:uncharacterized protein